MPRAGDVVAGKYRIEDVIGEGGMGAVYAATHTLTGKRVALKWMLPELAADEGAVQRFIREAQAAGRIDHPNVVDVYDVGEHDGSTFLVMEYLQGETLTAAFNRGGLDARHIIQLLIPAMRGVAAAHKTGVVHRDLKPDNVFLCRSGDGSYREPKVLDFGISKVSAGEGQLNPRLTRTGAVMGTPYYMSPEQVRGSSDVDQRTDVYAFGVILYEALTGRVPFDANAYSALVLEIATGTPKRLRDLRPDLPKGLEDVVLKAMARDPADRYRDVDSLARALEPFAEGVTFRSERGDPSAPQRSLNTTATPFVSDGPVNVPGVRRGSVGLVIASVGIAVAGGLIWALQGFSSEPESDGNVVQPAHGGSAAAASANLDSEHAPAPPLADVADAGTAAERTAAVPAAPARVGAAAAAPPPASGSAAATSDARADERGSADDRQRSRRRPQIEPAAQPASAPSTRPTPATRPGGRTGALRSDEF
jgi:eukaryotic-like serine/threonine-protein kinase